jgi:DNA adenine methylase
MPKLKTNQVEIEETEDLMEDLELEEHEINDDGKLVKPFLKWAGGKYKILNDIKKLFPPNAQRYIEPFVGAGSVALNVDFKEIIINDSNTDLTNVYYYLQKKGVRFIADCKELFVCENNIREAYAELKNEFNKTKNVYRKAVLFIYLNRHCFNGLCRYNGNGEFNTPIGNYPKPFFPEKQLNAALEKVKKFDIRNDDYKKILEIARTEDVIYCGPPYLPLSE